MHRSLVRPLLLSFSAWRDARPCVSECHFTPTSATAQKRTHPLHGEELDLIGPAFEKPEDVPEHGHGALQVAGGSLTHCATRRIDYDLTNRQRHTNTDLWSPPVK